MLTTHYNGSNSLENKSYFIYKNIYGTYNSWLNFKLIGLYTDEGTRQWPSRWGCNPINPITGKKLELDGYNEEHKFAFEFQGRHHFEENVFKSSNLQDIQYKDKIKKENCIINNTFLFIMYSLVIIIFMNISISAVIQKKAHLDTIL